MGLRELFPTGSWVAWGDMVDRICTVTYEAWMSEDLFNVWDRTVLTKELFERFGLDDFCVCLHQDTKSKSRIAAHAALERRLGLDLVKLIRVFL